MKRWTAAAVIAVTVLAAAPLALAQAQGHDAHGKKWAFGKSTFWAKGTVVATDAVARTVDVTITKLFVRTRRGYKPVRSYVGQTVTMTLTADARIRLCGVEKRAPGSFDDIAAGMVIRLHGVARASADAPPVAEFTARWAAVRVPASHRVGTLAALR